MVELDICNLSGSEAHASILRLLGELNAGEMLRITGNRDPFPLSQQIELEKQHPAEFTWAYYEISPQWMLDIQRVPQRYGDGELARTLPSKDSKKWKEWSFSMNEHVRTQTRRFRERAEKIGSRRPKSNV